MEKKQILCKRLDSKGLNVFWKEINLAFSEGWKYDENCTLVCESPRVSGIVRVTLVRGEEVVEPLAIEKEEEEVLKVVESDPEPLVISPSEEEQVVEFDELDSLTKKVELLEFAESYGVEVPEDVKQPAAIKKHIKAQLSN